nr:E3 ubiquitin-protein ligase RNF25 isoform X2 [Anolis sagrei ordinatus]
MAAAGVVAEEGEEAAADWILPSEVEVLESIYLDELQVSKGNDRSLPWEISIILHPATAEDQDSQYVCFTLVLSVPVQYPKEVPKITIQNPRGLSDEQIQKILQTLQNIAKARLGAAMLYELIETGKEILTDNNIPHGQCVICLYGFQENEAFIKTPCYHYFHSYCLASYTQHMEEEKRAQRKERLPTLASQPKEAMEDDVPCPVCRKPLVYDLATLQAAPPPQQPMEMYQPDTAMMLHREQLSLIYQRQQAKGGIIDPEAERNRYFISLQKLTTMESREESSVNLPKLEDKGGNFLNWKQRLELALTNRQLQVLRGEPPAAEASGRDEWLQIDRGVRSIISLALSEMVFEFVRNAETAKDMLCRLEQNYGKCSTAEITLAYQKLFTTKMQSEDDLNVFLQEICSLVDQLRSNGETISDKMIISLIDLHINESYKDSVLILRNIHDKGYPLSLDDLISELKIQFLHRHGGSTRNKGGMALKAANSQSKRFQNAGPRICHFCGKLGHLQRNCWKAKGSNVNLRNSATPVARQPGQMAETPGNSSGRGHWNYKDSASGSTCLPLHKPSVTGNASLTVPASDTDELEERDNSCRDLLFKLSRNKVSKEDVFIASDANYHYFSNKAYFTRLEQCESYVFGIGLHKVKCTGIGTVKLTCLNTKNNIYLENVKFSEELKTNLVALSLLERKGCRITFCDGVCTVERDGKVILTASHYLGLYRVHFKPRISGFMTSECQNKSCFQLWH